MAKILTIASTSLSPGADNLMDLGTSALQYKDLWVTGTAYIDNIGESVLVASDYQVQFRDTTTYLFSSATGYLTLVAGTQIDLQSTVSISGPLYATGYHYSVSVKTANYSLTSLDDVVLVSASGGAVTITLSDATALPNKEYNIKKIDSTGNVITIAATVDNMVNRTLDYQYDALTLISCSDASAIGWWIR